MKCDNLRTLRLEAFGISRGHCLSCELRRWHEFGRVPGSRSARSRLVSPSLNQLQPLIDQIGNALREANLDDAFRNWHPATPIEPNHPATPVVPPATPLPTTEKNRFLIEGDLADVVALYNAGAKAPHVALNLRGDFDFADARANVCLFGRNPDGVALTIRSMLAPYHLEAVTGLDQPCDPQRLDAYDVVAMQRGAFLKSTQVDALSLIKQIEIDAMRKFALVSAAELAERAATERAAIEQIEADVTAGTQNANSEAIRPGIPI
jgi:hypothetical protein